MSSLKTYLSNKPNQHHSNICYSASIFSSSKHSIVSFYFQHQQQQNILSIHDVGQIFIQVKEGGGHGIHPGHITFDEFMYVFALLALAMTRAVANKYHVDMQDICKNDVGKDLYIYQIDLEKISSDGEQCS